MSLARSRACFGLVALAIGLGGASCLITSNFDGLNGQGTSSASSGGSGGSGGDGTSSTPGSGGGGQGGATSGSSTASATGTGGASTGGGGQAGCGGMVGDTFPSQCVLDDFNLHDGPISHNWLTVNPQGYSIRSQQLYATQGDEDPDPDAIIWGAPFGPTQEVFVTIVSFDPADHEVELMMKNHSVSECGSVLVDYQPGNLVGYYCSTSDNQFHALPGALSVMFEVGDQFGARVYPDGTLLAYRNGMQIASWDASDYPDIALGGRIGVYSSGISGDLLLDDFGGGG